MTTEQGFSLTVSQNKHLADQAREMHAILRVRARGLHSRSAATPGGNPSEAELAEIIIVDCSGSMDHPRTKIGEAKRATAAAIDILPEGVFFAVVQGTDRADMVYPPEIRMAPATAQTRADAKAAVSRLYAAGGTAIGMWLRRARTLFNQHPSAVQHAILLTDGRNEHETADELATALADCAGQFVCDARGIGEDWDAGELLRITSALRGAARAVLTDSDLTAEFQAMIRAAMRKVVPDLRIRITTTPLARLRFVKQVHPTESDLAGDASAITHPVAEFSTGSWGDDSRDYHVCLDVDFDSSPKFEDLRVARVDLLVNGQRQVDPSPILVHWTNNLEKTAWIDSVLEPYIEQEEFSRAVAAGCVAHNSGDRAAAEVEWGQAVRVAKAAGNAEQLQLMEQLVHIVDPDAGTVHVKDNLQRLDINDVWTRSSYMDPDTMDSDQVDRAEVDAPQAVVPDRVCVCGRASPANAGFCTACGRPVSDGGPDQAVAR
jgi:Ca-activated chloride channel family protein